MLSIVRHGADMIFASKDGSIADEDIDAIMVGLLYLVVSGCG